MRTLLFVILISAAPVIAQPPNIDPPLVGRPDGFSNIVGKYTIQVSAEPTDVHVEESITLRIRIIGSGPAKYEPDRKHLDLFPNWDGDFYVQEMRDEHRVDRDQKTWLFVYRLKPKHDRVNAIDGIKLIYFDPAITGKHKFVTIPAEPIKITVKPKPSDPGPEKPIAVPDSFFEHAPASEVLTPPSPPIELARDMMVVLLIGGLLASILVGCSASRSRNDRRNDAAQRALTDLRAAGIRRGASCAVICASGSISPRLSRRRARLRDFSSGAASRWSAALRPKRFCKRATPFNSQMGRRLTRNRSPSKARR